MKKATVTVTFDDEKLGALEFSLRKEHSSVQEHFIWSWEIMTGFQTSRRRFR